VKNSRDITLIVVFAVLDLVLMVLIAQVPQLITGIFGITYVFTIFYAISSSIALLMYEGRRWRRFTQSLLFSLIALFLVAAWTPITAIAFPLSYFILDVIFNSVYGFFKEKNKLIWWAILSQVVYWIISPLWLLLFTSFSFSFQAVLTNWFIPIFSVMLPIMIIEAVAGGYIGYKIYRRVEKLA